MIHRNKQKTRCSSSIDILPRLKAGDSRLSLRPNLREIRMSYSVSTGRVETSPVQNDSGSVSVAASNCTAVLAHENPLGQQQTVFGSRTATTACHRRVGGRHQHHLPASPRGVLDQRGLGGANDPVGGLSRHPRPCQECGLEVLDSDTAVVGDNPGSPFAGGVLALPRNLLRYFGGGEPGGFIAFGAGLSRCRLTASHRALAPGKLPGGAFAVLGVRQVVSRVGGGGGGFDAPVDTDGRLTVGCWRVVALHNEAGVPVPEVVTVDADAAWIGGQLPRPHDRYRQATCQTQPAILHSEAAFGVVQARWAFLGGLELALAFAFGAFGAKVAQHLLLGDHRTIGQPFMFGAPVGQRGVADPFAAALQPFDRFVPHPTTATPLRQQTCYRRRAGAQPVAVADGGHVPDFTGVGRQHGPLRGPKNGSRFLPALKGAVMHSERDDCGTVVDSVNPAWTPNVLTATPPDAGMVKVRWCDSADPTQLYWEYIAELRPVVEES